MHPLATLFSERLREWYLANFRKLPWRETKDPYKIWLSEIILQQTRVQQGLPYYERYVERFPTVTDLAQADQDEVLRIWQGLGYYARARNLHAAARQVASEYGGKFPSSYQGLLLLKGVGEYTAAAIASFAFGESVAVLDGNVFRVLARVFGIETDIASPAGKKEFAALAQSLLPQIHADTHNQAVMEFGAMHCKPVNPICHQCVLADICVAKSIGSQHLLPVKEKKLKVKERHLHYALLVHGDELLGKKRAEGDIWQGLYDFFCIEKNYTADPEEIAHELMVKHEMQGLVFKSHAPVMKHLLTHQRLFVSFFWFEVEGDENFMRISEKNNLEMINFKRWQELPKPILLATYLHSSAQALNFAPSK